MATINTTGIFPSAKFISTNGSGDLQEVVSEVETFGSVTHDGLTFTANAGGLLSSPPSIEIVQDATATGIEFSSNGDDITMNVQTIAEVPAVPATFDEVDIDGITYKAEVAGDSGISVNILESQSADDMSFNLGVLTISLDTLITDKTQADIANLYALAGAGVKDNVELTFSNLTDALVTTGSTDLVGGTDEVPAVPATNIASYTQSQVQTAFNGASGHITGLISLSISDGSANLVSTLSQTDINGTNAVGGNLDIDSDYVLIKRTDLHDLEASEQNDGRKFLWGLIHKAEAQINALGEKPENFTISKGNPVSVDQGSALSQSYSVRVKYGIDALDLKAEA